MEPILLVQGDSARMTVIFNTVGEYPIGVRYNGVLYKAEVAYKENMNKENCVNLLSAMKVSDIMINSENYSSSEIHKHKVIINELNDFINETWPDYKTLWEKSQKELDNVIAVNRELNNEIGNLQAMYTQVELELERAKRKITSLKKQQKKLLV